MPPMLEYLDSLLTGTGSDLLLRTFKLVDQLSGKTLGLRADMTPQVARIDAHLLNRQGVTRLYSGDSVLHTLPASLAASRGPIQLGAELYGYPGIEADIEIIRLMARALKVAGTPASRIDISHAGVFRALVKAAMLDEEAERRACCGIPGQGCSRFCASAAQRLIGLIALPLLRLAQNCTEVAKCSISLRRSYHVCRKSYQPWKRCVSCRCRYPSCPCLLTLQTCVDTITTMGLFSRPISLVFRGDCAGRAI